MLKKLLYFLVGIIVLVVCLWLFHLVLPMLGLPAPINQIVTVVIGLIGLVVLIMLMVGVFTGKDPWQLWGGPPSP